MRRRRLCDRNGSNKIVNQRFTNAGSPRGRPPMFGASMAAGQILEEDYADVA